MEVKYFRVSETLWRKAQAKAKREGTTVSAVIRARLIEYTRDKPAA